MPVRAIWFPNSVARSGHPAFEDGAHESQPVLGSWLISFNLPLFCALRHRGVCLRMKVPQ